MVGKPISITIGVLALQGAFKEHIQKLRALGIEAVEVRRPEQFQALQGLILPGGESTTMGLIAQRWGLVEPLQAWVHAARPIWGTCAGLILLSNQALGQKLDGQPLLGGLDVLINRNYFGSQKDSFETYLEVAGWDEPVHAIFIRAPAILQAAPHVDCLATLATQDDTRVIVAVRQGPILGTAFHPELAADLRWHALFVDMVRAGAS